MGVPAGPLTGSRYSEVRAGLMGGSTFCRVAIA